MQIDKPDTPIQVSEDEMKLAVRVCATIMLDAAKALGAPGVVIQAAGRALSQAKFKGQPDHDKQSAESIGQIMDKEAHQAFIEQNMGVPTQGQAN